MPTATFRVPRSRVHETHRALREEILTALEPLLFGPVEGEGSEIRQALERQFAAATERARATAVHSGTVGLIIALRACGVGPGDEVITVANSDISTTGAISLCGAVPVLCDVLESDYTVAPDLVEALITERTTALLPVDLHGHPADVRALRELASGRGLRIVEDATLATGAQDHGRPVGAFADAAVFSFAPLKPVGSVGSGGMITCDDPEIAERIAQLSGYGHDPTPRSDGYQSYVEEGYNVRLDPLQAALIGIKLPHLEAWTRRRRAIAETYRQALEDTAAVTPEFRPESGPTFRSYTIRVPDQRGAHDALRRAGVEAVLHYAPPIYRYPVYRSGLAGSEALPVTDTLATELLSLPVAAELAEEEIRYVVDTLRSYLGA